MATENKCPHCGKPVPPTALGGICPECMLKAGLADTGEIGADGTVVTKPTPPIPSLGDIAPHFPQLEILACLGRGGMGAVYKARQPKLDRLVALKILTRSRDSGITDTEFAARFQQEARALARLNHPDIVAVYDFGDAGGFHYLLMEYVDGLTLRQLLQTKKLPPEEALAIVPKICEALQFAHERGIIHRDIKPENILLDKEGRVKIADFGIAKILGTEVTGQALTGVKDRLGTPHYMAPEQVEKPTTVDHRADIYSLGVVFYEMLTGELPLGNFQPPSRKIQMDVRLDEVVLHALEKEPDRRYQHASEVKTDVETIAHTPPNAPVTTGAAGTPLAPMPNRWEVALISIGLTVFIALLVAIPTVSQPFRPVLTVLALLGLAICSLTLAGWWPAPSFLVPDSGFSGRNLPGRNRTRFGQTGGQDRAPMAVSGNSKLVWAARWTARVFGTLLLIFFGVFFLAEGLPAIAAQPEGVQLNFVALGLMLAGFAVGWKREGKAALLIASGWTLWHISEGRISWNFFQTPLPVAGLYAFCWWATHGRRTGVLALTTAALAVALGLGQLLCPTSVTIRGAVRDQLTGLPIADARLGLEPRDDSSVIDLANRPDARTGADGGFKLYVGWYVPEKQVAVFAPGFALLETNLGPRALGQRNVIRDFSLQPLTNSLGNPSPLPTSVPPVVVETFPVSGSANVDPAITELRVSFSKSMRDGGWSWVKMSDETFPTMTANPRYLSDGQTCVLPVKLQPGRLYAVWINYEGATNFRDADGQAALPYLLIFETRK